MPKAWRHDEGAVARKPHVLHDRKRLSFLENRVRGCAFSASRERASCVMSADSVTTILIVEDEALVRTLLADELRDQGAQVLEAGDAVEALDLLTRSGPIDLVFSDIHMPGEFDGLELAMRIQAQFPDVLVMLTSGHRGHEIKGGRINFIQKPYDIAKTVQTILGAAQRG